VERETPVASAAAPVAPVDRRWWQEWYVLVAAGLVLAILLLIGFVSRGGSGRLSPDERAQLLADVKASLERGPRASSAGGAA
jgi:hypothetical protein